MYTAITRARKPRLFAALALAGLLTALCFPAAGLCGGATPAHVPLNMQLGIDNADAALFEAQVDFTALVGDVVDFMASESKKPENAGALPPALALVFSSVSQSREARDRLVALLASETREFVRYGINSGAFAGRKAAETARPGGFLTPFFADASMGRKRVTVKGPAAPVDGKGTLVALPVNVYDYGSGYNYPVTLVLKKSADGWTAERVANLDELYRQIKKEAASAGADLR